MQGLSNYYCNKKKIKKIKFREKEEVAFIVFQCLTNFKKLKIVYQ